MNIGIIGGTGIGLGYVVPIVDVEPKAILRSDVCPWHRYTSEMTLAERGAAAVCVVKAAIRSNRFPLWVCDIVTSDHELDINGTDIIVNAKRRIQVKCDWRACTRNDGGTGNLFVQTHERNPLKIYGLQ